MYIPSNFVLSVDLLILIILPPSFNQMESRFDNSMELFILSVLLRYGGILPKSDLLLVMIWLMSFCISSVSVCFLI